MFERLRRAWRALWSNPTGLSLQAPEPTSEVPNFIVGSREEWQDFERRNKTYVARFSSLREAVNLAFGRREGMDNTDTVILTLSLLCGEDFREIELLCGNGYGFGATKLLRGMYERVVTARHLARHPEETEKFLSWGTVDTGKRARAILEAFADELPADDIAKLKRYVEEGRNERQIMVIECDKCGKERPHHSWTRADVVTMAKADKDANSGLWIVPCYLEPTRHLHANASGIDARVTVGEEGGISFVGGPSREEADTALMFAHLLMLNLCELLLSRFDIPGLREALDAAGRDYVEIWTRQDAPKPANP
jgi:hypothetical protein